MRAAFFEGPGQIVVRETADPVCPPGGLLTRVDACAICGTDLRAFEFGSTRKGEIIGHETVATVIQVGDGVDGFEVGDRVADCPVTCGTCRYCAAGANNLCVRRGKIGGVPQGGFAELRPILASAVSGGFVVKIPRDIPPEQATLIEPLACVINGNEKLDILPGASVVILGSGPIGILHLIIAKARGAGATILVDLLKERLKAAKGFGADYLVSAAECDPVGEVRRLTGGTGADIAIVACVSSRAQEQALEMVGRMGQVLMFAGLPDSAPTATLNTNLIHYNEIRVLGARSSVKRQWYKALELIQAGQIDASKIVTHTVPLEDIRHGFELAKTGKALKVAVMP